MSCDCGKCPECLLIRLGHPEKTMSPSAALDKAIARGYCTGHRGAPGSVIARLPADIRESLKDLKAEHAQVRIEYVD